MKARQGGKLIAAKRLAFSLYYALNSKKATEWLNEKLEIARIADEKECVSERS